MSKIRLFYSTVISVNTVKINESKILNQLVNRSNNSRLTQLILSIVKLSYKMFYCFVSGIRFIVRRVHGILVYYIVL